jgi:hypothetical protein
MTPYTVHYIAQRIRHERGLLAAEEKWIQSPTFSVEEALKAIAYRRKILDAYERSLGSLVIDEK